MRVDTETIVAMIVGTLAVGRAVRLFVDDDMPLFKWFREWWVTTIPSQTWAELIICPFCVAIYISFASVGWAFASDLHWTWWFVHLALAGAYVAAMINVRDVAAE